MKKSILTVIALLLVISLVGCASGTPANSTGENTNQHILTKEEAKNIVFTHANVKATDVTAIELELDEEDGAIFYDLEFDYQDAEYDYRVDARSGKILYNKSEPKGTATQSVEPQPAGDKADETKPTTTTTTKKKIGVAAAKNAAFQHAKVKVSDAWDVEVDLDTENGKLVYEVSFDAGGYDYDYDIDAYTGKVIRSEKEKDD